MTKKQTYSQSEVMKKRWSVPGAWAKVFKNRSKNKSWAKSRHKCAIIGQKALHENHKESYLDGQKRSSITMKLVHLDPVYKKKHCKIMTKIASDPKHTIKLRKAAKKRIAEGKGTKFWEFANKHNGPSKLEFKILKMLQNIGLKPIHQFPVPNTSYVGDMYFPKFKLIVEVDGHPSHYTKAGKRHKRIRERILHANGFRTLHLNQKILDRSAHVIVGKVTRKLQSIGMAY